MSEGVKRWDAFLLGALFELFLVSEHLLSVMLSFSLFFWSLFLWCCFLPSFLLPLALWKRGWIVVDLCLGRTKSSVSSQGGYPSPSRSQSPAILLAMFDISCFRVVLFPSSFWSQALQRKGGIGVDWCSGRTKSSVSSGGGHVIKIFRHFNPNIICR